MRHSIIFWVVSVILILSGCIDLAVTQGHRGRAATHGLDVHAGADMVGSTTTGRYGRYDRYEGDRYERMMWQRPTGTRRLPGLGRRRASHRSAPSSVLRPTKPRKRRYSRLNRNKPLRTKLEFWLNAINETIPEEPFTCGRYTRDKMHDKLSDQPAPRNRSKRFVINGDYVTGNDFPYFLKLVVYQNDDTYYYCGAVLITRKYALTSNNCFYQEEPDGVHVSHAELHSSLLLEDWDNESVPVLRVGRVCPMPLPYEDMAVLRLMKPITEFTRGLYPICLPRRPIPYDYGLVTLGYGFNDTNITRPELHEDANRLRFFMISRVDCHKDVQPEESCFKPISFQHRTGKICAGDLGGPIIKIYPNSDSLAGLILASSPTCEEASDKDASILSLDLHSMGSNLDKYINNC